MPVVRYTLNFSMPSNQQMVFHTGEAGRCGGVKYTRGAFRYSKGFFIRYFRTNIKKVSEINHRYQVHAQKRKIVLYFLRILSVDAKSHPGIFSIATLILFLTD